MDAAALPIPDSWEIQSLCHRDERGSFAEAFVADQIRDSLDINFVVAQINISISKRNVIRGVHGTHKPSNQMKYVMCVEGRILDCVVDLRPESASFGRWASLILDDHRRNAVLIGAGLGHAFQVLEESATVVYAVNEAYGPSLEYTVDPLDKDLSLPWSNIDSSLMSHRDRNAPSLVQWRDSLPAS